VYARGVLGFIVFAFLFVLANARVARIVGERWEIEASVAAPRWGLLIAADVVIWVVIGELTSRTAALALAPIVALLTYLAIRRARPRVGTRGHTS